MDPIHLPLRVPVPLMGAAIAGIWWCGRQERRALAEARAHSAAAKQAFADAIQEVPKIIQAEFAEEFRRHNPR